LIDARQESCVETSLTFHNIPEKNAPSTYTITSSYASIDSMETNLTELIKTTQVKRKERNRKNEKKTRWGKFKEKEKSMMYETMAIVMQNVCEVTSPFVRRILLQHNAETMTDT